MLACSYAKENTFRPSVSRIFVERTESGIDIPITCRQCEDEPCIKACPENALVRDLHTGAIIVVDQNCTGCSACVEACPFGVIKLHPDTNKAIKCDLCGGDPACIKKCPFDVLKLVTESEY